MDVKRLVNFAILCAAYFPCSAQAAYMHEAAEDSSIEGFFDAIGGLAAFATIIMFILIAFVTIFAIIPSKLHDMSYDRKYEKRRKVLENEANSILLQNNLSPIYMKINSNPCFKKWFVDGYYDGVSEGRERKIYKPYRTDCEIIGIEEYVKRRHFEGLRKELMGGDVEFSKIAFTEGIKQGAIRREEKGDLREMLN